MAAASITGRWKQLVIMAVECDGDFSSSQPGFAVSRAAFEPFDSLDRRSGPQGGTVFGARLAAAVAKR